MRLPRAFPIAAAALVLTALTLAAGATALPPTQASNLVFGPALARADIVATTRGAVRLHRVERGRVRSVGSASLVVQWRDGATTIVPVADGARVTGMRPAARRPTLAKVRRGMHVVTLREGSSAATRVHVLPASARLPRSVLGPVFGPAFSRAGIVHRTAAGVRLYWVDRGRIRAVGPDSITLHERDGSTPQLELSPEATISAARGRPDRAQALSLRRGMLVETVREGDGPVVRVHVLTR